MPELTARHRLHGGTKSASDAPVKAVSRASGGAPAPALTRASDADTLKPRKSTLTSKTVAYPRPLSQREWGVYPSPASFSAPRMCATPFFA